MLISVCSNAQIFIAPKVLHASSGKFPLTDSLLYATTTIYLVTQNKQLVYWVSSNCYYPLSKYTCERLEALELVHSDLILWDFFPS